MSEEGHFVGESLSSQEGLRKFAGDHAEWRERIWAQVDRGILTEDEGLDLLVKGIDDNLRTAEEEMQGKVSWLVEIREGRLYDRNFGFVDEYTDGTTVDGALALAQAKLMVDSFEGRSNKAQVFYIYTDKECGCFGVSAEYDPKTGKIKVESRYMDVGESEWEKFVDKLIDNKDEVRRLQVVDFDGDADVNEGLKLQVLVEDEKEFISIKEQSEVEQELVGLREYLPVEEISEFTWVVGEDVTSVDLLPIDGCEAWLRLLEIGFLERTSEVEGFAEMDGGGAEQHKSISGVKGVNSVKDGQVEKEDFGTSMYRSNEKEVAGGVEEIQLVGKGGAGGVRESGVIDSVKVSKRKSVKRDTDNGGGGEFGGSGDGGAPVVAGENIVRVGRATAEDRLKEGLRISAPERKSVSKEADRESSLSGAGEFGEQRVVFEDRGSGGVKVPEYWLKEKVKMEIGETVVFEGGDDESVRVSKLKSVKGENGVVVVARTMEEALEPVVEAKENTLILPSMKVVLIEELVERVVEKGVEVEIVPVEEIVKRAFEVKQTSIIRDSLVMQEDPRRRVSEMVDNLIEDKEHDEWSVDLATGIALPRRFLQAKAFNRRADFMLGFVKSMHWGFVLYAGLIFMIEYLSDLIKIGENLVVGVIERPKTKILKRTDPAIPQGLSLGTMRFRLGPQVIKADEYKENREGVYVRDGERCGFSYGTPLFLSRLSNV